MQFEGCVSDAIAAAEALFWAIRRDILSACPSPSHTAAIANPSAGPSYDEIKNLAGHLCMLSGHLRSLQIHYEALPRDQTNTTAPTVTSSNTNFKSHLTEVQDNADKESESGSSHSLSENSDSSFDLTRMRKWTSECKDLHGELIAAAVKPVHPDLASEICSIALWPLSTEETARFVEMVREANGRVPQLVLKTHARKSLLSLLSSYNAKAAISTHGEDIEPSQLRSPLENPDLLDTMLTTHPRAEEIFSAALSWVHELDGAFVITPDQLCQAVAIHLCPEAKSMSELETVTEHHLLQICGDYLRVGPDGSVTTESREITTQTIPSHLRIDLSSLAHAFLRMLNFPEFDAPVKEAAAQEAYRKHRNEVHPLYPLSAHRLPDLLQKTASLESPEIQGLLRRLFATKKSNNFTLFVLELFRLRFPTAFESLGTVKYHAIKDMVDLLMNPTMSTLHVAACLGLSGVCEDLIQQGEHADQVSPIGAPFYCALAGPVLLALGNGSVNMKVVSDGSFSVEQMKTVRTLRHPAGGVGLGVSAMKKSLLATAIFTSTQHEDLDFFKFVINTAGLARRFIHSLCKALKDPSLINHAGGNGVIYELPESTRNYFDGVCELLIDVATATILDIDENDSSYLQPLEEAAWELAIKLKLPCSDSRQHRPFTFLNDDLYRTAFEMVSRAVVISDKIPLLSLKRLLQDRRSSLVVGNLPSTLHDSDQTLLHIAVERRSIDLIDLLLAHCPGASLSARDALGRTPLHLCDNVRVLQALVRHKVDLSAPDHKGRTVWHNAAANNDLRLLEALLQLDPAKDAALAVRTKLGMTPLAEAFLYVRELTGYEHAEHFMADSQKVTGSIRLLMAQVKGRPDCWESSVSLLHLAVEWGLPLLVHHLRLIGYQPTKDHVVVDGSSPLHRLNFSAPTHLVRLLEPGKLYKWPQEEPFPVLDKQERSPAEAIFFNFHPTLVTEDRNAHPSHFKALDKSTYKALLTREVVESRDSNGATLWTRFIANVFGRFSASSQLWPAIAKSVITAFRCLLQEGAMAFHEKVTETCGLLPFLSVLPNIMWGDRSLEAMKCNLLPLIDGIVAKTQLLDSIKARQEVTDLLTWAIVAKRPAGGDQDTGHHERHNFISRMLKRGVSVHAANSSYKSALATALLERSMSRADLHRIFQYVDVDKVNLANHIGRTVLELLCLNGDAGGVPDDTSLPDLNYRIMMLVRAGADPNIRDSRGWPLVLSLVAENRTRTAQIMIEAGANVLPMRAEDGEDIAIFAVKRGNLEFLEWLQRQAIPGFAWDKGCMLQHRIRASLSNRELHSISGCTGLHVAALLGYLQIVKFYLTNGHVAVDCPTSDRQLTPLHFAALGGHMEVIGHLAANGADLMVRDVNGATPLFYAVWAQQPGSVRKLLALGVSPNHKDFHARSPLSEALEDKDEHSEVYRLLSEAAQVCE